MSSYDINALKDDVTRIIFDGGMIAAHGYLDGIYEMAEEDAENDIVLNNILSVAGTILDIGLRYPQSAEEIYSAIDIIDWWNDNMPDCNDWQQATPLLLQSFATVERLKALGNDPKHGQSLIKNASYLTAATIVERSGEHIPYLLSEEEYKELKKEKRSFPDITADDRKEQIENETLIRDLTYQHAMEMMEIAETRMNGSASAIVAARAHRAYELFEPDHDGSPKIRDLRERYITQCAKEGCANDLHEAMNTLISHTYTPPHSSNLLHAEKPIITLVDAAMSAKHRNNPTCLALSLLGLKELTFPENYRVFADENALDRLSAYQERYNTLKKMADQFLEYKNPAAQHAEIDNKNNHKGLDPA